MYIIYVTLFSITIKQILLYVHHKTDLSPQNSIATDFFLMQNKSIQTESCIWSFRHCIFGFKFGWSIQQYRPSTGHADAEGLSSLWQGTLLEETEQFFFSDLGKLPVDASDISRGTTRCYQEFWSKPSEVGQIM